MEAKFAIQIDYSEIKDQGEYWFWTTHPNK